MIDITTQFAGLKLKNPIIISSSGLTNSAEKNQKLAEAGAGAIVLKSLFEEQIVLGIEKVIDTVYYPEGVEYLEGYIREHALSEYLNLVRDSKAVCDIPVIASINCHTNTTWTEFAAHIEQAGADALEINILSLPSIGNYEYGSFEQLHIDILREIKQSIGIPVIMKLGSNFTNPVALIEQLYANGAAAVVLFNRFYPVDIDIEHLTHKTGDVLSHPADLSDSLRWVGIASSVVNKMEYAVSGGVHAPADVAKSLLAGASAVEICSTIYRRGNAYIEEMLTFLQEWMQRHGFTHIAQFNRTLNSKDIRGINMFERTQFLKYFSNGTPT